MRYTEKDIPKIKLSEFMDALGEKPVKNIDDNDIRLYYAPYRDDVEPMLVVDNRTGKWYDHATDETGDIYGLAKLTAHGDNGKDLKAYILHNMNENEKAKEMLAKSRRSQQSTIVKLDISNIKLTDFMKALGQPNPVAADGELRIYKAPYSDNREPTMVINVNSNLWRDTKSGAYGGIYDLAYELTGSTNRSELTQYIAGEMNAYKKKEQSKPEVNHEPSKAETNQPKHKFRR